MLDSPLFPSINVLYFYISTFRSMWAAANRAVFCSSLISCFTLMLLRYFLNDFQMVPVALIITDTVLLLLLLLLLAFGLLTQHVNKLHRIELSS
jgi:hypothetical protein